jgi:RNA polymerase sigma-70 factor (ECF subfamily)
MLWSEHEADDVAQEVFVRAYCHLKKFRGDSGFYTWLYRIAVNVVYTHAKKSGRRRVVHAAAQEMLEHRALAPLSPEKAAQHDEIMIKIHQGLQTLDPRLREVLILRDMEGLDTSEVAQVLHIPVGTVKSRLFRAQEDLREWLKAHGLSRQEGES